MAAELWQQLGYGDQLDFATWPEWDEAKIVRDTITIVVQVNGKVRAKLTTAPDTSEADITAQALADDRVAKYLTGPPKKVIYVKRKLVSIVV